MQDPETRGDGAPAEPPAPPAPPGSGLARRDAPPGGLVLVGGALLATLVLGVALRWWLAGGLPLPGDFRHLRHAHSHLGYYAVLFPLAWLGWRHVGASVPGPRLLGVYSGATGLAFVGFLGAGYGAAAIAGSAVVGLVWLLSAWRLRHRVLDPRDPLGLVLPGVVLAEACIVPIAASVDADPARAQAWVATFLSLLLLAVIVPSALAARGVRARAAPLLAVAAALGAAALGVWPGWPARAGLLLYAGWLGLASLGASMPVHLRTVWAVVAVGLAGMALGLLPDARPVVVGAVHFLVLGPVLASLAPLGLARNPGPTAWWGYHVLTALLAGPLLLQGMGVARGTMTASALGGTGVLLWWGWTLARSWGGSGPGGRNARTKRTTQEGR